ncbi:hypothetical protein [Pseudooceanicola sp.]|uniref:hypothetical protein n=1 Tax=Pseudooceanicola sp. TaxID=1914328 RepID=UPI0035C68A69
MNNGISGNKKKVEERLLSLEIECFLLRKALMQLAEFTIDLSSATPITNEDEFNRRMEEAKASLRKLNKYTTGKRDIGEDVDLNE